MLLSLTLPNELRGPPRRLVRQVPSRPRMAKLAACQSRYDRIAFASRPVSPASARSPKRPSDRLAESQQVRRANSAKWRLVDSGDDRRPVRKHTLCLTLVLPPIANKSKSISYPHQPARLSFGAAPKL